MKFIFSNIVVLFVYFTPQFLFSTNEYPSLLFEKDYCLIFYVDKSLGDELRYTTCKAHKAMSKRNTTLVYELTASDMNKGLNVPLNKLLKARENLEEAIVASYLDAIENNAKKRDDSDIERAYKRIEKIYAEVYEIFSNNWREKVEGNMAFNQDFKLFSKYPLRRELERANKNALYSLKRKGYKTSQLKKFEKI